MSQLISVIIPTYNRSNLLIRAIDSVLAQTYQNFEIIVVDDGSQDDTATKLLPLVEAGIIKYYQNPNTGVSFSRNFGAGIALGDYLAFLDSDDEWLPHKLKEQIQFLNENKHLKIVYGEELWVRNGKRVNQKAIHKKSGGWIFKACVEQCLIGPSSVLIEKSFFLELQGFNEQFIVCEDYDLWLRISSIAEIGFLSKPQIIKHGGHADQLSTRFFAMDLWRLKSMAAILASRNLSKDDRLCVVESMKQRGSILMQGYQKHGNTSDYILVEKMLQELLISKI